MRKLVPALERVASVCDKISIFITGTCAIVILLCLLHQVVTRALISEFSQLWTSEIARLCLIVATFNGGAVALHRGELVAMTFIIDRFPAKFRKGYDVVIHILTVVFLGVFVFYAVSCIPVYGKIKSLTLPMDLAWVVALVALGGILILIEEAVLFYKAVADIVSPQCEMAEGGAE